MIPVLFPRGVAALTPGRPAGSGRADALRLLPQLDPGEIISARVEAKLPDGSYKVLLAGQPLRMALPSHIEPGATLDLTFVTHEPRLTFAFKDLPQAAPAPLPPSGAGRLVAASTLQAGEPALPSSIAPDDTLDLASVMREPRLAIALSDLAQATPAPLLSAAGRLVAAIMLQPGEPAFPVMAAAAAPLLAARPADGARLSGALARTLADSGLFYESHQAEWVDGKRELAQIRQEPQARLTQSAPPPEARAAAAAAAANELAASANAPGEQQTIHPRTVPLVQQQLAVLDGARVVLQLEVWPRQWMQWEIEDSPPEAGREPGAPQSWNTRLRLELPQLGELEAALTLAGDGVRIRLETASAASAALLQDQRGSLHAALAAAGVPPAGLAIAQHA